MRPIKVGILGAGFVSHIHMEAFKKVAGVPVEVAAVVSRGRESAEKLAKKYNIKKVYSDYKELLADEEIDVVDIVTPNHLHEEMCIEAAKAGKHIICEKPLTAAFGRNNPNLDREQLYQEALDSANAILKAAEENNVKVCYAEDFIYAPAIVKAKRLLKESKGAILEMRSEESHSGSHAQYSRRWEYAGGGSLLRLGSHPIGAVLHMKHYEGMLKYNKPIRAKSVICDVANLTHTEQFKKSGDKWLVDEWVDVEDWARGYPQEMQDFMEAIAFDRDPISDGQLGLEVVAVTYAAYLSAEKGTRVEVRYK